MILPTIPMSPILSPELPSGSDWGFQLKWDGVRTLATVDNGQVSLYSKRLLLKNDVFPEIVDLLAGIPGRYLLDGEIIMFDTEEQKPNFQMVLKRERSSRSIHKSENNRYHLSYVLFDLLHMDNQDLRLEPYETRHQKLLEQFPNSSSKLFITDLITNGPALWEWVQEHRFEGVVSKRLSAPYLEGKKHKDWFKKKIAVHFLVEIVGITIRNGKVASLVMRLNGDYVGLVSLGLTEAHKQVLLQFTKQHQVDGAPWHPLPAALVKEKVQWIPHFPCYVTGLELTSSGVLRHPQIVQFKFE